MNKGGKKGKGESLKSKPNAKPSIQKIAVPDLPNEPPAKGTDTPAKLSSKDVSERPSLIERNIKVTVETLTNIQSRYPGEVIRIVAEFGKDFKKSTEPPAVEVAAQGTTQVQWIFSIPFFQHTVEGRNKVLTNPLLFTFWEHPEPVSENASIAGKATPNITAHPSVTSKGTVVEDPVIFGRCNLDLMPLLLGETRIRELLIVEQEISATADDVITWANLPRMVVTAEIEEPVATLPETDKGNVLFITVESLYNALPSMLPSYRYQVVTRLPTEEGGEVRFDRGSYRDTQDRDGVRRWMNLADVEGRGSGHKKSLGGELTGSELLQQKAAATFYKDTPRIEWNFTQRFWLTEQSAEKMFHYICWQKMWPLEIVITKIDDQINATVVERYAAYVDTSSLSQPGMTCARVVSPVVTWAQQEVEGGTAKESTAVFTESGEPVFVILEMELLKPLTAKRAPTKVNLNDLLPRRPSLPKYVMGTSLSDEHSKRCIENATSLIASEYIEFKKRHTSETKCDLCYDEDGFYPYLVANGTYQKIKETLRYKIVNMVSERMIDVDTDDMESLVQDVYKHAIEEMRTHIDKLAQSNSLATDSQLNLRFYAEEAMEEFECEVAHQLYSQRIINDVLNPEVWLEYSVFCAIYDIDGAIECIKEALSLDSRHVLGIFMYAMFLSLQEKYSLAEMYFHILLSLYPEFTEGWVTLYLFYLKQGNHDAADIALKAAWDNPMTYRRNPTIPLHCIDSVSLSWTSGFFPNTSLFLGTAELLLKLHALFYSEMALAQELLYGTPTLGYWYYYSVNHYLDDRFEDALCHLKPYAENGCQYYVVWALVGHCHYRLSNTMAAIECYEAADLCIKPVDNRDCHLVSLRLGDCYLSSMSTTNIKNAKRCFLAACEKSPSPKSWLYFGIACYKLLQGDEAERALLQANRLVNDCPIILTYLSLVYLKEGRDTESVACFRCV